MDRQAQTFSSAQTDLLWDQYESVVKEHTVQSGTMWVRKKAKNVEMATGLWSDSSARTKNSADKYLLLTGGKVQVFQPKINQVIEYDTGKNRQAFESLLLLGFGGAGIACSISSKSAMKVRRP